MQGESLHLQCHRMRCMSCTKLPQLNTCAVQALHENSRSMPDSRCMTLFGIHNAGAQISQDFTAGARGAWYCCRCKPRQLCSSTSSCHSLGCHISIRNIFCWQGILIQLGCIHNRSTMTAWWVMPNPFRTRASNCFIRWTAADVSKDHPYEAASRVAARRHIFVGIQSWDVLVTLHCIRRLCFASNWTV